MINEYEKQAVIEDDEEMEEVGAVEVRVWIRSHRRFRMWVEEME